MRRQSYSLDPEQQKRREEGGTEACYSGHEAQNVYREVIQDSSEYLVGEINHLGIQGQETA